MAIPKRFSARCYANRRYHIAALGCALWLHSSLSIGQSLPGPWALCTADPLAELLTLNTGIPLGEGALRFTADEAEVTSAIANLSGGVLVEQGDQQLQAPDVELDRGANRLRAKDVSYGSPQIAVSSEQAELDLTQETGRFEQSQYYLPQRNAQGSASVIELEQGSQRSRLYDVSYSTCARGAEFWQLRSRELELDQVSGRGYTRDLTFAIKDVPILYLPYLSFPINDQRQSGWLAPTVGIDSDSGVDVIAPYYWNIAPNYDATFYPRWLSKRGFMLGTELRFQRPHHDGIIRAEYLPDDRKYGDDRSAFKIEHRAAPLPRLRTDLLYQHVSDDDYLDDLDNNLDLLSPIYLERHFDASYSGDNWTALARVQSFQTLDSELFDPTDEPYERLPQLRFDGYWPGQAQVAGTTASEQLSFRHIDYEIYSELVHFDHDDRVTGTRIDVLATAGLPLQWPAGFLTPRLSYRYTGYNLDHAITPGGDEQPNRSAPIASLDSGLFFDRNAQSAWLGEGTHNLEPRLFYLYVPSHDQSDIPLFDTTEVDQNFNWLFLENRFIGADRLGDANQLTAALTSRWLSNSDGSERFRASVGQIFYFEDRDVTLNNTGPDTETTSDLIGEAQVSFNNGLGIRGTLQWNPDQSQTNRSALDLSYRPSPGRLLNFSHRFARDDLDQLDLTFVWPISSQWRALGRYNYSLRGKAPSRCVRRFRV